MLNKVFKFFSRHKLAIIFFVIILGAGIYYYRSKNTLATPPRYMLGTVEKGMLINSVSGTGQVSAETQIDIKPKVSASITSIQVKEIQNVKAGEVLAQLDSKDLANQVKQTKSSLDIAKANLNLTLAGPTQEDIFIAKKSVESAKISYDTSMKNLESAKKTAEDDLKKAQLAVTNAQLSLDNAQRQYNESLTSKNLATEGDSQDLTNAYNSAKITISSAIVTMRNSLNSANNILKLGDEVLSAQNPQSLSDAETSYTVYKNEFDSLEKDYNKIAVEWNKAEEEKFLGSLLESLEKMRTLQHDIYTVLTNTISSSSLTQTSIDGYKQTTSSQESSLVSSINSVQAAIQTINNTKLSIITSGNSSSSSVENAKSSLESAKNSLVSAQNSLEGTKYNNQKSIESAQTDVTMKKISYDSAQAQYNLKVAKPRPVDIEALKNQVTQAENTYLAAVEDLNNAKIIAPIDGIIAKIYQKVGDDASPSTAIITIVTAKKLAIVSLNEVDIAKIELRQKATLTFSAVENLTISGEVVGIDTIGTVTQGVVNYSVKIGFDTDDERIKPQMSVAASIILSKKTDALLVPASAVKSDNNGSYVEVFKNMDNLQIDNTGILSSELPEKKYITTGDANDTSIEVIKGLNEGDKIITRIITSTPSASTQQTSGLRMFGGGGGGIRMGGGGGRPD